MQISIVVVIDIKAALKQGTLDGNAYVIDNTKVFAPVGVPPKDMVTYAPGSHNLDGSQADETVLNWMFCGVAGLPPQRSRGANPKDDMLMSLQDAIDKDIIAKIKKVALEEMTPAATATATKNLTADLVQVFKVMKEKEKNNQEGADRKEILPNGLSYYLDGNGKIVPLQRKIRDARGIEQTEINIDSARNIAPIGVHLSGPAVDNGVLYPAMYGSPVINLEGWYWSASVDTMKHGEHEYELGILLYEPKAVEHKGETIMIWSPREFTMKAYVNVSSSVKLNGFTEYYGTPALPMLPILGGHPGTSKTSVGDVI